MVDEVAFGPSTSSVQQLFEGFDRIHSDCPIGSGDRDRGTVGREAEIGNPSILFLKFGNLLPLEIPYPCGAVLASRTQGFAIGTVDHLPDKTLMAIERSTLNIRQQSLKRQLRARGRILYINGGKDAV